MVNYYFISVLLAILKKSIAIPIPIFSSEKYCNTDADIIFRKVSQYRYRYRYRYFLPKLDIRVTTCYFLSQCRHMGGDTVECDIR